MPFVQAFAGENPRPLGTGTARTARRSWTDPSLLEELTSVEEVIIQTLNDAATTVASTLERVIQSGINIDEALAGLIDRVLPVSLGAVRGKLIESLVEFLTEEVGMAGAEEMGKLLPYNLSAETAYTLSRAQRSRLAGAQLSGSTLPSMVGHATPPSYPPMPPAMFQRGGDNTPRAWFSLRMDLVNPYAVDFASRMTIRLADVWQRDTLQSVRNTVTMGYNNGWGVDVMADLIARKVGLFPRWSRAVDNFYQGFVDRGADHDFAQKQADAYAVRLRGKRSMMIARTETMRASNYGRMAAWNAMGGMGLLQLQGATKEWVTGPHVGQGSKVNSRVTGPCDICAPMDGVKVPGVGGLFNTAVGQIDSPPTHPHCRCTVILNPPEPPSWEDMGGELQWLQDPGDARD